MTFWKSFGPGILFAGAAIGTSHLVQSTRAGAMYGIGLLVLVIVVNLIKYPAYRFGPEYAAATGKSLIEGYHALGRWVLILYVILEVAVISIIIAATAIVTAAILLATTAVDIDPKILAVALIAIGAMVLVVGGYKLLDGMAKLFVAILTVTTIAATALSLPYVEWTLEQALLPTIDLPTFTFMIALMGFMPAGIDLSVLQSLWSVAKSRASGVRTPMSHAIADFNVGYITSALLAICFLLMGAGVMHAEQIPPATEAADFAKQVISLYTTNLGDWAGTIVGISATFVMFTTLITILDGMPRLVASGLIMTQSDAADRLEQLDRSPTLYGTMAFLSVAATLILLFLMDNFQTFIDFVTIAAFIVAPITAILNHLVMHSSDMPKALQPSAVIRIWSKIGILFLSGLSVIFLYVRFVAVN